MGHKIPGRWMSFFRTQAGLFLIGSSLLFLIHGHLPADTGPGSQKITRTLSQFPARMEQVFIRASWGLDDAARFECELVNDSGDTWNGIQADGGCTCLQIKVKEFPKSGLAAGESVTLSVAYEKPDEAKIVHRTIRLLIDGAQAELPVVVAWQPPLDFQAVTQQADDCWLATGLLSDEFELASIDSLNKEVEVLSWDASSKEFAIRLRAKVRTSQYCSLRCIVKPVSDGARDDNAKDDDTENDHSQDDASVEQMLAFSLESSAPRSIPSRLVCRLDANGKLSGSTRILFPRIRRTARPDLLRCEIASAGDTVIPMQVSVDKLGRIAMTIEFESAQPLPPTFTQQDSEVRFLFKDGSQVSCQFQIEEGQN